MVMGMITSLVLIFGVFGFGSDKIVNEEYNAEQARREEIRKEAARADSLDELTIRLTELGSTPTGSFNEAASSCLERIALSKEIIERGPTDEPMRERAVCEGILATIKLYGLDYTQNMGIKDIGVQLESSYAPYLDDENEEIYQHARVAQLTHRSFEEIKSGGNGIAELADLFSDTIKRFPESEYVASMIEAHLFVIVAKEPAHAKAIFAALESRFPAESLSPKMSSMMINMSDRLTLHDENYERKFADRWANGLAGRRELVKTASRLLGKSGIGDLLIRRMNMLGQWFERNEFLDESKSVYQEIQSSVGVGNVHPVHRELASSVATEGMRRLDLIGKTIDYRGIDKAGKPLMDEELKKRVVIVVYWSKEVPESVRFLAQINANARSFGGKPISILAICVDDKITPEIDQMRKSSRMLIVEPEYESGKNSLLEACVPGKLPHVMLVNTGGKVHDVNADPEQVKNKALSLLLSRNR